MHSVQRGFGYVWGQRGFAGKSHRVSTLIIFECATCRWMSEAEALPPSCTRCLARTVQVLSDEQVQDFITAGLLYFCRSCDALHLR